MVRHMRADITQYTIWHITNTAPAVARRPELRNAWLMKTDIEALSDFVENLMWGYARCGWLARLPGTLDRLKANIDDPRWVAKIAYHRGICALWQDDRDQAAREIAPLQPITADNEDVDLLQLEFDLHGSAMGMIQRLAFCDRIREISRSRSDRLQYGGARAFEILLSGDEQGACAAFDTVVILGRTLEEEKPLSPRAEIWFCKALEGRAMLERDPELFAEIDKRLTKLVNRPDEWTPAGKANLLRSLGDCRRYGGVFEAAIATYRASHKIVPAPELQTFEAECELHLGHPDEAYRLVRSVAVQNLDAPERADHAFISFYIALARGDRRSLIDARDLLRSAVTPQLYFERQRLQHIVTIGDALEAIQNKKPLPEAGPFSTGLQRLSRYVMLQPNWNGIGINGNAMIDDFVNYTRERAKRDGEDVPTYNSPTETGDFPAG